MDGLIRIRRTAGVRDDAGRTRLQTRNRDEEPPMGHLLRGHAGVYLLGALLLLGWALPVASPDELGLDSVSWPLLLVPVVGVAAAGGVAEGLAVRSRRMALAWFVLAGAALLGMVAPLLLVSRWSGEPPGTPTDAGLLVAAELGWAVFAVLLSAVTSAVGRR